jgi:multiple sugar transport system substrate-binding protein
LTEEGEKMKLALFMLIFFLNIVVYAQTEVVWWDYLGSDEAITGLIEDFNADPNHIDVIQIKRITYSFEEFNSKFYTSVQAGTGPDILIYEPDNIPLTSAVNLLRPLTVEELESVELYKGDYTPNSIDALTYDGNLYGVPFFQYSLVFYYNKDVLRDIGLLDGYDLPNFVSNPEDFNDDLQSIKDSFNELIPIVFANEDEGVVWQIYYSLLNQQEGVQFIDYSCTVNQEGSEKALQTMADWNSNISLEYSQAINEFSSGNAAMLIAHSPLGTGMVDEWGRFDWGMAPFPTVFDHSATWGGLGALAIPVGVEEVDRLQAILEVISWMSENSIRLAETGKTPVYLPVQSEESQTLLSNNQTVLGEGLVFNPRIVQMLDSDAFNQIVTPLIEGINGRRSTEEMLPQFTERLQDHVQQFVNDSAINCESTTTSGGWETGETTTDEQYPEVSEPEVTGLGTVPINPDPGCLTCAETAPSTTIAIHTSSGLNVKALGMLQGAGFSVNYDQAAQNGSTSQNGTECVAKDGREPLEVFLRSFITSDGTKLEDSSFGKDFSSQGTRVYVVKNVKNEIPLGGRWEKIEYHFAVGLAPIDTSITFTTNGIELTNVGVQVVLQIDAYWHDGRRAPTSEAGYKDAKRNYDDEIQKYAVRVRDALATCLQ